ncbi:hydrolase [Fusarium sp. NRRL 25303]|nr:hydrolase [Fusarium sp. NRRL 25303]
MTTTRSFVGAIIDRVVARSLDLPPEICNYSKAQVRIPLPDDGPVLVADLYRPLGQEPLGTILVRTPYSRGITMAVGSARIFAARGYQVLFVSSRGTFGSEGTFDGGFSEEKDGQGVVKWMREQSWYTGSFATLGMSYSGYTQWALLKNPPHDLTASVIIAGPHDYSEHIWGTGAFNMHHISWSSTIVHQENGSRAEQYKALYPEKYSKSMVNAIPLSKGISSHFSGVRSAPWLEHAVSHHDTNGPTWSPLQHGQSLEKVTTPIFLITGWSDIFIQQTMEQYERLKARKCPVKLLVGPWTHLQLQNKTTMGPVLKWMNHYISDPPSAQMGPAVEVGVMGNGTPRWLTLPSWPPASTPLEFFLMEGGTLGEQPPSQDAKASFFTFDPLDPTPTLGGPLLVDGGCLDDTALSERTDIVVFTTILLAQSVTIMGKPSVKLVHSADCPSVDLFVRLSIVDKQGKSRSITQQYRRLYKTDGIMCTQIDLLDTAFTLRAGSCLRLIIGGGSHPMYSRNVGTGEISEKATATRNATHSIFHGAHGCSKVILPVFKAE